MLLQVYNQPCFAKQCNLVGNTVSSKVRQPGSLLNPAAVHSVLAGTLLVGCASQPVS